VPEHPLAHRPWLSAYSAGVPADLPPVDETLVDMFDHSVSQFGAHVAIDFFARETTYAELGQQVSRVAEGLRRLGVKPGDRVAIVLPNSTQDVIAFYAALRIGAIVVHHNPTYTAAELEYIFADHEATVAIVWSNLADTVAGIAQQPGSALRSVVSVNLIDAFPLGKRLALSLPVEKAKTLRAKLATKPSSRNLLSWSDLTKHGTLDPSVAKPLLDDTALIQYTSGTTGKPKGVILSHRNLRTNAEHARVWLPLLEPGHEIFYAVLPFFHVYGLTLLLTTGIMVGAKIVLFPSFDLDLTVQTLKRTKATFLPAVPPIYEALVRSAERGNADLQGIKYAMCGAASLPTATVQRWVKATGGMIIEGYGLSETSPVIVATPARADRKLDTVGVPLPSTLIRVIDPEHPERDLPVGERGELLVKGPQVFSDYWRNPQATADTFLPGGWFRTGDIVVVGEDGYVTIVDRLKDLIVTGGYNVAPSEVETALLQHPGIADACVVGLKRKDGGEDVAAAVVMLAGATFDAHEIKQFCSERLAPYKIPRRVAELPDLPKSLLGKAQRSAVRDAILAAR